MNKAKINELLPKAYDILKETGIADENHVIISTYQGYISTFGAAVSGGSLLAAIAFFSNDKLSDDKRSMVCSKEKLMRALYFLVQEDKSLRKDALFQYIKRKVLRNGRINLRQEAVYREELINGAIALKLAMNLYEIDGKKDKLGE